MPIAEAQTGYIANVIATAIGADIGTVEPTEAAEEAWVNEIIAGAGMRRAFLESCTPSYFNYEGKGQASLSSNEPYPGGGIKYLGLIAEQTAQGIPDNLETSAFVGACRAIGSRVVAGSRCWQFCHPAYRG
jgi:cyclohexanone monooxygenase